MNLIYDTKSKIIKCRHATSVDSNDRHCRYPLDSVLRLDATPQHPAELRHVDSAMPFHSHDVDADDDRRVFFVEGQYRPRSSHKRSTMADRICTPGNTQCVRNSSRSKQYGNRYQANYRCGQALLEMAFLIPMLVLIIGATISFGLFFFQANVLQQAVDVGAQEISRFPFKPNGVLGLGDLDVDPNDPDVLMNFGSFQSQIFNEKYLVIHDSEWLSFPSFTAFADQLPLLNRLLVPVMIRDLSYSGGVTRFPGAVVRNAAGEETVLIPIINYDTVTGKESLIQWVAPVEEIRSSSGVGPYNLNASTPFPGMVALRINFPAQSTTLVNRTGDKGQIIIDADDASISNGNTGSKYSLVVSAESGPADTSIYSGRFGLGRQAALLRSAGVRPYRKVLSVQAIYRREVFN